MFIIPPHIQKLQPYKPGKPDANIFGDNKPEREVVLSSNENNFGPSPLAMEAYVANADKIFLYPDPVSGQLKQALSAMLNLKPENLSVGNGSDSLLYNIMRGFFGPGQTLLTSAGAFVSAKKYAAMSNIPIVETPMIGNYEFDLQTILDHIDDSTQVIYIVNPNNPTGTMISTTALADFVARVPEHIIIVIDEAYCEFSRVLSPEYPDATQLGRDNIIVLRTFSKAYGMAGLRLGYAIGAPVLISTLNKVKLTFDPNNAAQAAGVAALDDIAFLEKTIENNRHELPRLYHCYDELGIKYVPGFGNFVMLDLGTEVAVEDLYEQLKNRGVLTRRLASFGIPQALRVTVGTPEDNDYLMAQLRSVYLAK
jgi:histidinol-phosphate aminotransferase